MITGLLWYDASLDCDLAEKVLRAARRYRRKFREAPNICHVHPSEFTMVPLSEMLVGGIEVISSPTALLHHFLIGRRKEN